MEKEKVYLVYGHYHDNLDLPEIAAYANFKENLVSESYADAPNSPDTSEIDLNADFKETRGKPWLALFGHQESIYCLSYSESPYADLGEDYWYNRLWLEAKERYGAKWENFKGDTPKTEEQESETEVMFSRPYSPAVTAHNMKEITEFVNKTDPEKFYEGQYRTMIETIRKDGFLLEPYYNGISVLDFPFPEHLGEPHIELNFEMQYDEVGYRFDFKTDDGIEGIIIVRYLSEKYAEDARTNPFRYASGKYNDYFSETDIVENGWTKHEVLVDKEQTKSSNNKEAVEEQMETVTWFRPYEYNSEHTDALSGILMYLYEDSYMINLHITFDSTRDIIDVMKDITFEKIPLNGMVNTMKKVLIMFLCICVVLVAAGCANKEDLAWTAFDPNKHKMIVVSEIVGGSPPYSLEPFEDFITNGENGERYSVIFICKVARGSINMILDADDISIGGKNYNMTEIEILEIHFKGSEVTLEVGDKIFLREPYFFITKEASELLKEHGRNTFVSMGGSYYPMEKEKVYLIYGAYVNPLGHPEMELSAEFETALSVNQEMAIGAEVEENGKRSWIMLQGHQESIYCLSYSESPYADLGDDYWYNRLWLEARERYGAKWENFKGDTSKTEEQESDDKKDSNVFRETK